MTTKVDALLGICVSVFNVCERTHDTREITLLVDRVLYETMIWNKIAFMVFN